MKHLRMANGSRLHVPTAKKESSDMCLLDYSHCEQSDICWILDTDTGCSSSDNCIVDIS